MPDKYEFRRFADNLTHPWFNDASCDLKQIWFSPNRLLLCILLILLLNIDDTNLIESGPDWKYDDVLESEDADHGLEGDDVNDFGVVIFDGNGLVPMKEYNEGNGRCTDIPIFEYLGKEKKNMFHTQLMIGVMFGFMMRCRIPILLTIINFIIRSGGSFKPKIVPMFIDNATIRSQAAYGSSYRFLKDNRSRTKWEEMAYSEWSEEDISSSDDEPDSPDDLKKAANDNA